jgi:hypothetical protein
MVCCVTALWSQQPTRGGMTHVVHPRGSRHGKTFDRAASMHGYAPWQQRRVLRVAGLDRRPDWGIGPPRSMGVRKGSSTGRRNGGGEGCPYAPLTVGYWDSRDRRRRRLNAKRCGALGVVGWCLSVCRSRTCSATRIAMERAESTRLNSSSPDIHQQRPTDPPGLCVHHGESVHQPPLRR